ncbi:hypothetical protein FBY24_1816 [Cellulomonas sp. SLBN-39]|nr:hypothetical protein FBY24_1816 [Cellulomonas sp. SLBN-39]
MRRSWWGRGVVVAALVSLLTAGVTAPAAVATERPVSGVAVTATPNRPPSRPTEVRFTTPSEAVCVTGADRPLMRRPDVGLSAVLSDPEGGNVAAVVEVRRLYRPNTLVWQGGTVPQASGRSQSVTVDGLPVGSYRLRIAGRDRAGHVGPSVTCDFSVIEARLAAPTITPVAGYPGLYPDGGYVSTPGLPGAFRLSDGGADAVEYQYSWGDDTFGQSVPASDPVAFYTPQTSGPHTLMVRAVAADGATSTTTTHSFSVGNGRTRYVFDDLVSPTLPTGGGPGMTVSPTVTWVPGPLAEIGAYEEDRALRFDEPDDRAQTSEAPLTDVDSFAVTATLRAAADAPVEASAVTLDGATGGASLGYRACADGVGSCWSFETTGPDATLVLTARKVVTGRWIHVFGLYDADDGVAEVLSCTVDDVTPRPGAQAAVGTVSVEGATALVGSGVAGRWHGDVADVTFAPGRPTSGDMTRACSGIIS